MAAANEIVALLGSGHEVSVLSRKSAALPEVFDGRPVGRPEWLCPEDILMPLPAWSKEYLAAQVRMICLTRRIQRLRSNLLVVQASSGHRRAEMYRSWSGVPRIMTMHGSPDQFTGMYDDGVSSLERVLQEMACCDGFVLPSERVAAKWKAQGILQQKSFHIIHNCADEALAAEVVRSGNSAALRGGLQIPDDQFIGVCVASMQHRKGQDVLLSHLPAILQAVPSFHLYLVGPVLWGWGGREIVRLIEEHPHRDRVHLVGAVSARRALEFCGAADVVILPSREECLPITAIEALLMGVPVVASDVDGLPEVVEDGQSGLLFSHESPEELTAAVVRMARDKAFREACVERGKQVYTEKFTRQLYMQRWERLVREVSS